MKKKININGIIVLFILLILVALSTYLIPSGEYTRIEINGRTMVDASSFKIVESNPTSFLNFFKSIPLGLQEASMLIIMIFLIGGAIRVFESTGAIKAFIYLLRDKIGDKNSYLILILISVFFGCLGTFPGMLEAVIPFAPLCISIAITLGYDALVGISMCLIPITIGWSAGVTNPWTTGIGQSLAELPMFSGFEYRFLVFVIFLLTSIIYTLIYAKKIKNNPEKSLIHSKNLKHLEIEKENIKFTMSHLLVLIIFSLTIITIVYGSLKLKWNMADMSAVYIIGAILCGVVSKYSANRISDEIILGGKDMFIAAFAIGMARGVSVIMTQSHIIDTVVHYTASILVGKSQYFNAFGMLAIQTIINFFIPSGSGQAVVTLPVLLPVADLIGLNRQIAILAFQFGDGLSNLMYPTVGVLIALLSYSKISFMEWFKYIYKYMIIIYGIATILLLIAVKINFS